MKVFVAGGDGFVGRNVAETLTAQGHEVYRSSRSKEDDAFVKLDLLDSQQVQESIAHLQPEVIINCAGVVGAGADFNENVHITQNLIEAIASAGIKLHRLIICGSAGEYGQIAQEYWPVKETAPLNGSSPYARSKVEEERLALELSARYSIDTIVARIFNPIGKGMSAKFLIPSIIRQIEDIKEGRGTSIVVGRRDALRDYIDAVDVAKALSLLAIESHDHEVYNVGSGIAVSTDELLQCIIKESGLPLDTPIEEMSPEPEKPVASMADISRLKGEFSWEPSITLQQTIKGVVESYDAANK